MDHRIGPQNINVNGDTVFIVLSEVFLTAHIHPLLAILDSVGGGEGPIYILADVQNLKNVEREARRIVAGWRGVSRAGGTAIIGANLLTRTLVLLVSRASTLLSNNHKRGIVSFFKTEAEARAWVESLRAADLPSPPRR